MGVSRYRVWPGGFGNTTCTVQLRGVAVGGVMILPVQGQDVDWLVCNYITCTGAGSCLACVQVQGLAWWVCNDTTCTDARSGLVGV
jgi:hypothetical protein